MKKITSSIFVALLIAGASSVQAQDVKKGNTTTKTVKTDVKKVDVVKEMDATMVNPDGTVKETKEIAPKANTLPKSEKEKMKMKEVDPADAPKK